MVINGIEKKAENHTAVIPIEKGSRPAACQQHGYREDKNISM